MARAEARGENACVQAARVLARLERLVDRTCHETGISLPQYRLLLFISREPPRASELAGRAAVSRPTLTALVDGLERQGLLRREPVTGDRRGIRVELTRKGEAALSRADRRLGEEIGKLAKDAGAHGLFDALIAVGNALDRKWAEAIRSRLDSP